MQPRWQIGLAIILLVLSLIPGSFSGLAGIFALTFFVPEIIEKYSIIPGAIVLITLVVFYTVTISQGLKIGAGATIGTATVAGTATAIAVVGVAPMTLIAAAVVLVTVPGTSSPTVRRLSPEGDSAKFQYGKNY